MDDAEIKKWRERVELDRATVLNESSATRRSLCQTIVQREGTVQRVAASNVELRKDLSRVVTQAMRVVRDMDRGVLYCPEVTKLHNIIKSTESK